MEDTLREFKMKPYKALTSCLNPCYNGRYSKRFMANDQDLLLSLSLNPCYNGRYSKSHELK